MQIVQNFSTPGHGTSMHDARRRHDLVTRKALYQREAAMREATLTPKDKGKVANAARSLVNAYQAQRVSRQQIEEEQRADETRLKGWAVAKPQPGTSFAEEPDAIRYRMAVRAKALEEIASLELAVMISSTDRNRSKDTTSVPPAKPWRAGTAHGSGTTKRGKPISLREYNHCHDPNDGKFCSGSGGGGGTGAMVSKVAKASPDDTGRRVAGVMDTMRKAAALPGGKAHTAALRDRVKQIGNKKVFDYGAARVDRVLDWKLRDEAQRDLRRRQAQQATRREDTPEYGRAGDLEHRDVQARGWDAIKKPRAGSVADQARQKAQQQASEPPPDQGNPYILSYRGVPIHALRTYSTPYYYVPKQYAKDMASAKKLGSVNHTTSIASLRRLISKYARTTEE